MTITTREMLNAVIAMMNGETPAHNITSEDVIAKARLMLESLDKERKPSKADLEKQAANDALKAEIYGLLVERGSMIASDIVAALATEERSLSVLHYPLFRATRGQAWGNCSSSFFAEYVVVRGCYGNVIDALSGLCLDVRRFY